jgi:hypothetical protein
MELKEAIDTRCSVRNYGLCCGSYLKRRRNYLLDTLESYYADGTLRGIRNMQDWIRSNIS